MFCEISRMWCGAHRSDACSLLCLCLSGDQDPSLEQEKGRDAELSPDSPTTYSPQRAPHYSLVPSGSAVHTAGTQVTESPAPGNSHVVVKSGCGVSAGFLHPETIHTVSAGWWQTLVHKPHFTWAFTYAEGITPMGKKRAIFHWKIGQEASWESKHIE